MAIKAVSVDEWGFSGDDLYKPSREIVHTLTGIASNHGNMLLNVGPKPDASIDEPERERLNALGQWQAVYREAIENVSPCPASGGTYGCSAVKGDNVRLYVHWRHGPSITIANCEMDFSYRMIMGTNQAVTIQRDGKHIKLLDLPASAPDYLCSVIKLSLKK